MIMTAILESSIKRAAWIDLTAFRERQLRATITVAEQSVAYARDRRFVAHGAMPRQTPS